MKKYILIIVAAVIAFLIGNFIFKSNHELTFNNVLNDLNERREKLSNYDIDAGQYLCTSTSDDIFTSEEVKHLIEYSKPESRLLSIDEALEDVDCLFKIFKYEYGGYVYFGGDEVFEQAKENIVSEINKESEISITKLEEIIANELMFINDGHLRIGNVRINEKFQKKYYSNEKIGFKEDSKGFYTLVDGKKKYLETINNDVNVEMYMKLSIDERGHLVHYIGLNKEDGPVIEKIPIKYMADDASVDEVIDLFRATTTANHKKATFEEILLNDTPVITLRRFDDVGDETFMKDFVESGHKYKDEKALVIDLRGNSGGSSMWGEFWFENYTGYPVQQGGAKILRFGPLHKQFNSLYLHDNHTSYLNKYNMPELNEFAKKYYDSIKDVMNDDSLNYQLIEREYQVVDNGSIIFVLIDKRVGSSAEDFVLNLKTTNNVVVVGSNTYGCSDVLSMINLYLPNSRTNVFLGFSLDIKQEEPHFFDGVGLEPDIWLANSTMLERVLKLIESETIEN